MEILCPPVDSIIQGQDVGTYENSFETLWYVKGREFRDHQIFKERPPDFIKLFLWWIADAAVKLFKNVTNIFVIFLKYLDARDGGSKLFWNVSCYLQIN